MLSGGSGAMELSLLASTPDIAATGYMVNLLLAEPAAVAAEAKELGYDGIEFLAGPPGTVGVTEMDQALRRFDAVLTAVNSGRIVAEGLTLFHPGPGIRARALHRLKDLLDFAGHFGVPVTLAGVKGNLPKGPAAEGAIAAMEEVFHTLAEFGAARGSTLLVTPTDEADSNFLCSVDEVLAWVQRINHPGLGMMLDTHQLARKEPSLIDGLRAAAHRVGHLHLYDPGRQPPGLQRKSGLDWPAIAATLREIGYDRGASVCLARAGDRRALAQQTATYLRELIAAG